MEIVPGGPALVPTERRFAEGPYLVSFGEGFTESSGKVSILRMSSDEAKLFVAGLPDSMTEEALKQVFEATGGTVVSVSLPKDRATGRPRGFGFVTLSTPQQAQAARDELDGSLQAGRSISVRPFQAEPPRRDGPPGAMGPRSGPPSMGGGGPPRGAPPAPDRTLYVGNLPYDCTQQEIEELVNSVAGGPGSVVRVHLPMDPDGRKRGFGFVTMASSEVAKTAAEALATGMLRGRPLKVNIAHPKGDRPPGPPPGQGGFMGGGPPSGGGGPGGPGLPPRKPYEEKRRNKFEDGGGARKAKRQADPGRFDRGSWGGGDDD